MILSTDAPLSPGPPRVVRVLLVENHPAVREELAQLLAADGLEVCAQAETAAEALAQAAAALPEVALVDFSLGEEDSLALITALQARGLCVVVCSSYEGPGHVYRALEAGARAYVAKREAGQVLTRVIREVLGGWVVVSPRAAGEA